MDQSNFSWKIEKLIEEVIEHQMVALLKCGRRLVPTLTPEDMLQPNDYVELENNPHFRYEEGVLAGMQTIQMALRALEKEAVKKG
jgi:hypothetical protein